DPLFKLGKRYIRVPVEALEPEVPKAQTLQGRERFSRPERIVELIESENCPFWHAWHEGFQRHLGGLEQIAIHKQQDYNKVSMRLDKRGNSLGNVSLYQLYLWNVPEEAIAIVLLNEGLQLVVRAGGKVTFSCAG